MLRVLAVLCALAACVQLCSCLGADGSAAAGVGGREGTPLRVGFHCTGLTARDASDAVLRSLIAQLAGVPPAAVSKVTIVQSSNVGTAGHETVQVLAAIRAVNLAAPYARLSSGSAPGDLAAALSAMGATYSPHSLQVSAPAWAAEAAQAARDPSHEGKLRFIMSGVSLPDLDETRLRAVLGSVTGVQLGDVQILGVEYAVAARVLGRRGGDGYRTLRVTAAIRASAAAAGSLRLAAEERPSLAKALRAELGAVFREGSFEVTFPPGALSGTAPPAFSNSGLRWQQQLITFASAAAGAATFAAVFFCISAIVDCCCTRATAIVTAEVHNTSTDAAQWANPAYQKLPAVAGIV